MNTFMQNWMLLKVMDQGQDLKFPRVIGYESECGEGGLAIHYFGEPIPHYAGDKTDSHARLTFIGASDSLRNRIEETINKWKEE